MLAELIPIIAEYRRGTTGFRTMKSPDSLGLKACLYWFKDCGAYEQISR